MPEEIQQRIRECLLARMSIPATVQELGHPVTPNKVRTIREELKREGVCTAPEPKWFAKWAEGLPGGW